MLALKSLSLRHLCPILLNTKSQTPLVLNLLAKQSLYNRNVDILSEPFSPRIGVEPKICSPEEAVSKIRSNSRIYVHGAAATPTVLINALCHHASENHLKDIELVHIYTTGDAPQVSEEYRHHFKDNSLFIGGNVRKAVNSGFADYTPIFLSEIPKLFESPFFNLDYSLITVSEEDSNGYHSIGTNVDCTRSAIKSSSCVIGVINPNMPRTFGDGFIHKSHFNYLCYDNFELNEPDLEDTRNDPLVHKIGNIISSELIPNNACIQMGIGGIPDSVMSCLGSHMNLGVHTEMFSDGILGLIENGVITNKYKLEHQGKIVSAFCHGSKRLYNFINNNPLIFMGDCSYVCDNNVIRTNENVHAINTCIEIDITGQICADSIGTHIISGVGGQMDFMRGAVLSKNGKAIMALRSVNKKGGSNINSILTNGGGVVTTRSHVQYIVTEYGYVNLYGKTLRERAKLLISIAHPQFREQLEKDAFQRFRNLDMHNDLEYKLFY